MSINKDFLKIERDNEKFEKELSDFKKEFSKNISIFGEDMINEIKTNQHIREIKGIKLFWIKLKRYLFDYD